MLRHTLLLLSGAAITAACGGATTTELFADPERSERLDEPSEPRGHADDEPASEAYGRMDAAGGDPGGSNGGGITPGNQDDTPSTAKIFCGSAPEAEPCTAGSEFCCITERNAKQPTYTCKSDGLAACRSGLPIYCDDRSDCPTGQVCCASFGVQRPSAACRKTCGLNRERMCDPKAAVDECAEIGKRCGKSRLWPGYYICVD